ncbi:MAG: CpsD/CapB family tyrosine-protein kinase [Anaeromyxobacteraceae bacterium]
MMSADTLTAELPATTPESRLVALAAPESAAAEQYRVLLSRLARLASRRPMRAVAVTSAGRGEGRTTTAMNLALTAAQEGRAAVLVEADLRRPALAGLLGLSPRAGVGELLEGRAELSEAVARVGPLAVLCAGQVRDPASAARGARAGVLLEQLRAAYDLVVLDAPPAMSFLDGDRLAGAADGAILVVRAGVTPRPVVKLALEAIGDRAAGIVLNAVDPEATVHGRWIYAAPEDEPGLPGRKVG